MKGQVISGLCKIVLGNHSVHLCVMNNTTNKDFIMTSGIPRTNDK
ncbi:hypothetical protein PBCV1_a685cL [Paramecium bursaria Chlorella virus 1]|uniref:Uncharacterized protein n=1 Tax=Paramecium bursaria Chlorella virus 1 TaxID=10506 RepID=F8TU88_PBCV1|nr:hypothetical protein PBCV1_a685cL [Paramecium bursaria Chlorella virus 1]AEI70149.1 hypothetical protein [Paramecium bursaria Chlorella virus 1]